MPVGSRAKTLLTLPGKMCNMRNVHTVWNLETPEVPFKLGVWVRGITPNRCTADALGTELPIHQGAIGAAVASKCFCSPAPHVAHFNHRPH